MSLRRMSIAFAAISAVCAASAQAVRRATDAALEFAISIGRFILALVARPEPMLAGNGGFTGLLVGRGGDYVAPRVERHEAGMPRIGSPRNI